MNILAQTATETSESYVALAVGFFAIVQAVVFLGDRLWKRPPTHVASAPAFVVPTLKCSESVEKVMMELTVNVNRLTSAIAAQADIVAERHKNILHAIERNADVLTEISGKIQS